MSKIANFCFSFDACLKFSLNFFTQTNPTPCHPAFSPHHCDNMSEGAVGLWNVLTLPPHPCSLEPGCISQHDPKLQPLVSPESSMKSRSQLECFGGTLLEGIQDVSDERVEKPNRVATAGSYPSWEGRKGSRSPGFGITWQEPISQRRKAITKDTARGRERGRKAPWLLPFSPLQSSRSFCQSNGSYIQPEGKEPEKCCFLK